MTVELVTVKRVAIAKVGDWPVEKGWGKFTQDDITSMAVEAQASGYNPRLKLGHGKTGIGAVPAWGQVTNLEEGVDEAGVPTLYGDYVNVPKKLADALPSAFPGRSVEAVRGRKRTDGTPIPMVATAVALLGTEEPAMNTLGDHPTMDDLHNVLVGEADLAVFAARILDDMTPEEILAAGDSPGELDENDPDLKDTDVGDKLTADEQAAADKAAADQKAADDAAAAEAKAKADKDAADAAAEAAKGGTVTALPPGTIAVDAKQFEAMQEQLNTLTESRETEVAAARDTLLDEAVADKRIHEDNREAWASLLATDEVNARAALDKLPKFHGGPVHAARGHEGDPESLADDALDAIYGDYSSKFDRTASEA